MSYYQQPTLDLTCGWSQCRRPSFPFNGQTGQGGMMMVMIRMSSGLRSMCACSRQLFVIQLWIYVGSLCVLKAFWMPSVEFCPRNFHAPKSYNLLHRNKTDWNLGSFRIFFQCVSDMLNSCAFCYPSYIYLCVAYTLLYWAIRNCKQEFLIT